MTFSMRKKQFPSGERRETYCLTKIYLVVTPIDIKQEKTLPNGNKSRILGAHTSSKRVLDL